MEPLCWSCGKVLDLPNGKLSFSAECESCGAWLHCCRNCSYYQPGKPNDCQVPDTEIVADREKKNLCEEFSPLFKGPKVGGVSDAAKKLFGDDALQDEVSKGEDLFK